MLAPYPIYELFILKMIYNLQPTRRDEANDTTLGMDHGSQNYSRYVKNKLGIICCLSTLNMGLCSVPRAGCTVLSTLGECKMVLNIFYYSKDYFVY
jgi:hypothetical protein